MESVSSVGLMQEVDIFEIGGTEALHKLAADGAKDLNGGRRLQAGKNADRNARDPQKSARLQGDHVRRTRAVIDEGNFTKKIALTETRQFDFPVGRRGIDPSTPFENQIEAETSLAIFDDLKPFAHRHAVRELEECG